MEEIRKILKYSYYQNDSDFYFRMVTVSKDTAQNRGWEAEGVGGGGGEVGRCQFSGMSVQLGF